MNDEVTEVVSLAEVLAYFDRDRHLDMNEAEEYLSLSKRFIREHLNEIPHFRPGGRKIVFRKSELDRWMEGYRGEANEVLSVVETIINFNGNDAKNDG